MHAVELYSPRQKREMPLKCLGESSERCAARSVPRGGNFFEAERFQSGSANDSCSRRCQHARFAGSRIFLVTISGECATAPRWASLCHRLFKRHSRDTLAQGKYSGAWIKDVPKGPSRINETSMKVLQRGTKIIKLVFLDAFFKCPRLFHDNPAW